MSQEAKDNLTHKIIETKSIQMSSILTSVTLETKTIHDSYGNNLIMQMRMNVNVIRVKLT